MKKILVAMTLGAVMITTTFASCMPRGLIKDKDTDADVDLNAAVAVFTVDVNPGVRVYLDAEDTVIAVEATNTDGEAIVEDIDVEGDSSETAIDEIVGAIEENGYIEEENNSVLISVEKSEEKLTNDIEEKVNKAFEKRGKKVALIEQEIEELDAEVEETVNEISEKYEISKGKAHLIEKIREEFPELSDEELAKLRIEELGLILDESSDEIKGEFKNFERPDVAKYIEKDEAIKAALESVEIVADEGIKVRAHMSREDGKMVFEVEFVYENTEYEICVDAESGEIVSTETEAFEAPDVDGKLDEFCNKHEISKDEFHDQMKDQFGHHEDRDEKDKDDEDDDEDEVVEEENKEENKEEIKEEKKPIFKGKALKNIIRSFKINEKEIDDTDAEIVETDDGTIMCVTVEMKNGDVYEVILESYTGVIVSVELNGETVEIELPERLEKPEENKKPEDNKEEGRKPEDNKRPEDGKKPEDGKNEPVEEESVTDAVVEEEIVTEETTVETVVEENTEDITSELDDEESDDIEDEIELRAERKRR